MNFIFNADDFGRTETVNEAITYGFKTGLLSRTTIMVNMPYFNQAVSLAKKQNFFNKVGLHINLTSGEPLTESIKRCANFTSENGMFNGLIFKKRFVLLSRFEKKAVEEEIKAQIEKYIESGFTLMHADSHGHVHTALAILPTVIKLLKRYNFKSVRISRNLNVSLIKSLAKKFVNIKLNKFNKTKKAYFGSFKDVKRNINDLKLKKGTCEIMLHPNVYDLDMQIGEGLHYNDLKEFKDLYIGG